MSSPAVLEEAIPHALEGGFDLLLLDGSARLGAPWAELFGAPDLAILRDAVRILRRLGREEHIDLVYFGGVRSGTDAAKVIALGGVAVVLGVPLALAAGGAIARDRGMEFAPDHSAEERARAVVNIIKASTGEASMMARCTGKTNLQNLEPEDLRALTLAAAEAAGVTLAGTRLNHAPRPPLIKVTVYLIRPLRPHTVKRKVNVSTGGSWCQASRILYLGRCRCATWGSRFSS